MSAKDKWVRRFSVDDTAKHKNGFTIYKITSMLFPIESPEAMTVVSVWKRYSDVQQLHKSMRALHAGLHLRGVCPALPRHSYFKRFQLEVIEERAKTIRALLEFIAEHRLLFTSTDFVNFLQTGYPAPGGCTGGGVIAAIRSSLQLPLEDTPPLEYPTDDEDSRSPAAHAQPIDTDQDYPISADETDFISQIPVYEAADVEIRQSPKKLSEASSFESLHSIDSIDSDMYEELSRVTIDKSKPCVKTKSVLPDLINFDAPSTSKFEDYHTMSKKVESDAASLCSSRTDSRDSKVSVYSRSVLSLSNVECKTRTEDSYVFEAGYMLNLAARCEDMGDHARAFECYKSGIEKMLIGVQSDPDPQRRALIKEKTNKYLSYAEQIYNNHLCDADRSLLPEQDDNSLAMQGAVPLSMLKRPYEELSAYKVLAVLGARVMLVLHQGERACYALKVIEKVPNNLTEFDEYFLRRASETRRPVLPTLVPYMVPLHAYVETDDLIFLVLSYAPGEKLFDYIKNYTRSAPTTPAREVNLENVFTEPRSKVPEQNDNVAVGPEVRNNNMDSDVTQLVLNSQRLLSDVDRALSDVPTTVSQKRADCNIGVPGLKPPPVAASLPPSTLCQWGAQLLTALHALHCCGVVCRDLNPSNVLLGAQGQLILTYFPGGAEVWRARRGFDSDPDLYTAPELWAGPGAGAGGPPDYVCDYWSFGALMYELLCGVPLRRHHRSVFTSHTILHLPTGLPVEVQSLLSQLLTFSPVERLGAGPAGVDEIRRHPYFRHVDWRQVSDAWAPPD